MNYFKIKKHVLLIPALALSLSAVNSCKTVRNKNEPVQTTNAPVRKTAPSPNSKVAASNTQKVQSEKALQDATGQVISVREVGTAEVPQLTVNIDLTQCIGVGKWLDPKADGGQNPASISVVPISEVPGAKQQPNPWLLEPNESPSALHSNRWRMVPGSYSIEFVIFNVESAGEESKLTKKFDFSTTHDLVMDVVGAWLPTRICDLRWKTAELKP
jgi:hypothetical protein